MIFKCSTDTVRPCQWNSSHSTLLRSSIKVKWWKEGEPYFHWHSLAVSLESNQFFQNIIQLISPSFSHRSSDQHLSRCPGQQEKEGRCARSAQVLLSLNAPLTPPDCQRKWLTSYTFTFINELERVGGECHFPLHSLTAGEKAGDAGDGWERRRDERQGRGVYPYPPHHYYHYY